jgi:hypothetical protein
MNYSMIGAVIDSAYVQEKLLLLSTASALVLAVAVIVGISKIIELIRN